MAKFTQERKTAGRCRTQIKPGKQSVGQRQLQVIRVRYYPEVRDQVQRQRTGQDRKSAHGLGSVSGHTNGWTRQQPTLPASLRQRLKTPDWANRAGWFTDRRGWRPKLRLVWAIRAISTLKALTWMILATCSWFGDNLTICGDHTVLWTMQKRYSQFGNPHWENFPGDSYFYHSKKKRAIFNLNQKQDFFFLSLKQSTFNI